MVERHGMSARFALHIAIVTALPSVGAAIVPPTSWAETSDHEPVVTGDALLSQLTDPSAELQTLPAGARVVQVSSREREGGNRDWGIYSDVPGRARTFVGREDDGYVLLDERQPGCVTRMWFTAESPIGSVEELGRIQLLFDGEKEPRVDVPADDFFAGRVPGFPMPLVGESNSSSGGFYSYVPFCFAESLKVQVTGIPSDRGGERLWYQITATVFPHDTTVRTYRPGTLDTAGAASALDDVGAAPPGDPLVTSSTLQPGGEMLLVDRDDSGSVRHLRFTVAPFDPDTLSQLELSVTVDGAARPQLAVPLDVLFGDGLSVRPIRSLAFGMDPATGMGYFSLPIPFENGMTARLRSQTTAAVRSEIWLGPPVDGAGVLHGRSTTESSVRGLDATLLETGGSGRLAALVVDLVGPPGSNKGPLQYMLEGDERVYVDGARSPSIHGTGLEDIFNGGFYYSRGPFSLPTHGAGVFLPHDITRGARSQYRVFAADGVRWEDGLRFQVEHGGGDENDGQLTTSTPFWYAGSPRLERSDRLLPARTDSSSKHRLHGEVSARTLTAYFEGDQDGNAVTSTEPMLFGGTEYPAPPPEESRESVTADGVAFTGPISFNLAVASDNCGVLLRRQVDGATPNLVDVAVDGRHVGTWSVREPNPAKRWRVDDLAIHPRHTADKSQIRVVLTPSGEAGATAFAIEALSRTSCSGGATAVRNRAPEDHRSASGDTAEERQAGEPAGAVPTLPATGGGAAAFGLVMVLLAGRLIRTPRPPGRARSEDVRTPETPRRRSR